MDAWNKNLNEYLADVSNLIDCFLTIGFTEKDLQEYQEFGQRLEAKILSQFPPADNCKITVPESLPNFIFPNGEEIIQDLEVPSSLYSTILTDQNGELLYCNVLKVYEVCGEKKGNLCEFTMEIDEVSLPNLSPSTSLRVNTSNRNSPVSPLEPMSPSVFSFYEPGLSMLPKGLVIVSKQPLFNTFQKILVGLYKLSKKSLTLPMECYISHMILQIPLPSRGHVSIRYLLEHYAFNISLPPVNKFPVLDLNLGMLFHLLSLDNLLTLFRNVLLERSTVFISTDENRLMCCTYSVLALIFPFHWNMVYVPILPINLLDYLYSPVTFIFGVHSKNISEIYSRVSDTVCIIDLDNNRFLVSDIPSFHRKSSANIVLPQLPEHYGKKLKKTLLVALTKSGISKGKTIRLLKPEIDLQTTQSIRHSFFQFFVSILKDYKKFMLFDKKDQNSDTFNAAGFLATCPDKDFMNRFIETQMFSNFCECRIRPKNVEEHCEGLYFDEEIAAKENRSKLTSHKAQLTFINDASQEHNTVHTVPAISTIYKSTSKYKYESFPDFDIETLRNFEIPSEKPPKFAENLIKVQKILPNWRTDQECLLTTWMDLWGFFLSSQDPGDLPNQIQELISVAGLLQNSTSLPTISIYKSLLVRCFHTNPSLAIPLFSFMDSEKIAIDAETLQLLQKIVSRLYATDQNIVMKNTGTNLIITQSAAPERLETKVKRVFTRPEDINVFAKQEVSFIIKELCKNCGKVLKVDEIRQGWEKVPYKYETSCVQCTEKVLPKLTIRVGLEIGFDQAHPTSSSEETLFISPQALRQVVNDLIASQKELSLHSFRTGYSMIFWNAIWYFNQKGLPFEFLLMYDKGEITSELFLTTDEIKVPWNFENSDKSVQTDLTLQDILLAENQHFQGFSELLSQAILI